MEDGNRLDLTLSLPCGRPSAAAKGKTVATSEAANEADRGSKLIDDFKNFLDGSNHKDEPAVISQRIAQSKPDESIFYDLSKGAGPANVEGGSKRKNVFDEINNKKRHERDAYLATLHIKPRAPHVSDDGSTAENEDVADSEANDVSKGSKESPSVDLKSQRAFTISSGNVMNLPYSFAVKESNSGSQQPVIPANLPLQHYPSYFGRGTPNSNKQNDGLKINQGAGPINTPKSFERAKEADKKTKEDGPSMPTEHTTKGINVIDQPKPESLPFEQHPAIRPGIAADLKFGGSGSSPNLPWVSTTGLGPNGKTISGVTYRYSGTQIRIVCACHGSHMSPDEFVQHANEEQPSLNGAPTGLPSFSNSNPAASAQN